MKPRGFDEVDSARGNFAIHDQPWYHDWMSTTISHDSNILSRVIQPADGGLAAELSQAVLKISFSEADRARMAALSEKARLGTLIADEQAEIDSYDRIGTFLSLLKSKARTSLGEA